MSENAPLTVGSLFSGIPPEASTSGSSGPACEFCGSASATSSADGSLPGIGPESRVIPMCAPLWASPKATEADRGRRGDLIQQARGNSSPTGHYRCPCRCHTSTSSAAGSLARTSASPAAARGSGDHARVFGGSLLGSLASFDATTSSWRTSQLSLLEDSASSLGTLPRAGSMRNGTVFQRRPLVPLTGGIGSGLLPTPKVPRGGGERSGERAGTGDLVFVARRGLWPTPHGFPKDGQARNPGPSGNELGRAVNEAQRADACGTSSMPMDSAPVARLTLMIPEDSTQSRATEPIDCQSVRWPMPNARDWKGTPGQGARERGGHQASLPGSVKDSEGSGSLNPTFVEWLMGFPKDWTAV